MKKIILTATLCILLPGCVETVAVGAVATGVMVASDKSISQTTDDILIKSRVNKQIKEAGLDGKLENVEVKVYEGRVVLLGKVDKREYSRDAVKAAWGADGVKEIIDETMVYYIKDDSGIIKKAGKSTKDTIITGRVKTKFMMKKNVKSVNFDVETVDGVVYLLGVAQDQDEVEESAKIASKIRGVKKVVSLVVLKSDPRRES
jgi:osmotically-inducible protein OsmY